MSSSKDPHSEGVRQRLKTKLRTKQPKDAQVAGSFDLDMIQSVGDVLMGQQANGDMVLVLLNRACMDKADLSTVRSAICSAGTFKNLQGPEGEYEAPAGNTDYLGLGMKFYAAEAMKQRFASREDADRLFEEYERLEDELRGVMPGMVTKEDRQQSGAIGCFSSYFPDTAVMTDRQMQEGVWGTLEPREDDDENEKMRKILLRDHTWLALLDLPAPMFDRRQTALALYDKHKAMVQRMGLVRLADRMLVTDRITSVLYNFRHAKSVYISQLPHKPWIAASLSITVAPEHWAEFMAVRKAMESRFLVWYLHNRRGVRVDLVSGDGVLVAKYDPSTCCPPDQSGSSSASEADKRLPLIQVRECKTAGAYLREECIADDAKKILKDALGKA